MSRVGGRLRAAALLCLVLGLSGGGWHPRQAPGARAAEAPAPGSPTVEEVARLLRQADESRARGIVNGVLTFRVTSTRRSDDGERSEQAVVRVYLQQAVEKRGQLVVVEQPGSLRGNSFLLKGADTWMYRPGLRSPLRISGQQRLFGDASVGEAAGIVFSAEYDVRQVTAEALEGEPTWRVELEAKRPSAPYRRATVWVGQRDGLYRRAVLYSVSGIALKQLDYEQWGTVSGRFALVRLAVRDLLQPGRRSVTVIETQAIADRTIPERYFRPEFLNSAPLLLGEG